MSEVHEGYYTELDEPLVQIELIGHASVPAQMRTLLVDSGFNRELLIPLSVAMALGWPVTQSICSVKFAGGESVNVMETRGYVRFLGKLRQISVLAITEATRSDTRSEIDGYIGMGLLKGSRLNFGRHQLNISAFEG